MVDRVQLGTAAFSTPTFWTPCSAPASRSEDEQARQDGSRIMWEDSIRPVDDAGQIELWSGDHQISEDWLEIAAI